VESGAYFIGGLFTLVICTVETGAIGRKHVLKSAWDYYGAHISFALN